MTAELPRREPGASGYRRWMEGELIDWLTARPVFVPADGWAAPTMELFTALLTGLRVYVNSDATQPDGRCSGADHANGAETCSDRTHAE